MGVVDIATRSSTNQGRLTTAPMAVARMPRTLPPTAMPRPLDDPAAASMRTVAERPRKYAIGPRTRPGRPDGMARRMPKIEATSEVIARPSVEALRPSAGGG